MDGGRVGVRGWEAAMGKRGSLALAPAFASPDMSYSLWEGPLTAQHDMSSSTLPSREPLGNATVQPSRPRLTPEQHNYTYNH